MAKVNAVKDEQGLEFLAGYVDNDGVTHKDFDMSPTTGRDEEEVNKPDVVNNGGKIARVLLENRISRIGTYVKSEMKPEAWRGIIQNLLTGDQDYALLKLRAMSFGSEFELPMTCPKEDCKAEIKHIIDLDELEIKPFKGFRSVDFTLKYGYTDKKDSVVTTGTVRLPNGLDRELLVPLARKNIGLANSFLLERCTLLLGEFKPTADVIKDLRSPDREAILEAIRDNYFGPDLIADITCPVCGYEFKTPLTFTNFT